MPRPSVVSPFVAGMLAGLAYVVATRISPWAAWPLAMCALIVSICNHSVTGAGVAGAAAAILKLLRRLFE